MNIRGGVLYLVTIYELQSNGLYLVLCYFGFLSVKRVNIIKVFQLYVRFYCFNYSECETTEIEVN